MSIRSRLDRLELGDHPPGHCPACRMPPAPPGGAINLRFGSSEHDDSEALGYWYQEPGDDVKRPYPPDPRPICSTCGRMSGILLLWAVYDPEEWRALNEGASVPRNP